MDDCAAMQVSLKLYASLGAYLPDGAEKNVAKLDIADGTTIRQLLDHYNVPPQACHLVLLNGLFQPPAVRGNVKLKAGDALAVWPPVAGG
jgi:molybdopterin converting factor small subunit